MKSFNVRDDTAQKIIRLAAKNQMEPEALVNKILEHYLTSRDEEREQSGTAFLLSIAGMFDSGPNDTSERVQAVVADSILQKYRREVIRESNRR